MWMSEIELLIAADGLFASRQLTSYSVLSRGLQMMRNL